MWRERIDTPSPARIASRIASSEAGWAARTEQQVAEDYGAPPVTRTDTMTVSGTVWVNIWVDGATAGSNAYTMTVGSSTVWSQSSTDTHVALPWVTTNTPNGPQTLVAAVRDASGNTGSGSVSVTVQNGSAPPPKG